MGFLTTRTRESGFLSAIATWVFAAGVLSAQPQLLLPASEYEVKAAFLYNCAKFVEWPNDPSERPNTPISVCILGKDPFGPTIEEAVRGKTAAGRPLSITRAARLQELRRCHILFISSSEQKQVGKILADLTNAEGVLTVGETEGFTEMGGMINLTTDENRIRFEINAEAAGRHGLKISSRLLQLVRVIRNRD